MTEPRVGKMGGSVGLIITGVVEKGHSLLIGLSWVHPPATLFVRLLLVAIMAHSSNNGLIWVKEKICMC